MRGVLKKKWKMQGQNYKNKGKDSMSINSTTIDAPWRSILQLIKFSYPWCTVCEMDCREVALLQCPDCGEKCNGCLSRQCECRYLCYDMERVNEGTNDK